MPNNIINFSANWNNKLDCMAFTTIRLRNSNKYQIGKEYKIILKKNFKKNARIEAIKTIYFNQINEFIAHLDTGYSAHETKNIIKKMYSKVNLETQPFSFILLKTLN
ncbi:hypothetical protein [uncultured Polaribacter sp.]|uniref:ASCH domain-containing protein n=1 Tax=uncultured Polaribacter sp. TaxID=174711 RepID=UPI00261A66EB|nr:hypothetical protein [uncultured Polaribacter sp.]